MSIEGDSDGIDAVLDVVRHVWGWDALYPMQREAIDGALGGRDSLLVLPTGGGKSLCYQIPPLVRGGLAVVVSPLIALMKDQVDGLRQVGVAAASLHGEQESDEQARVLAAAGAGELRLLYVTPERLVMQGFLAALAKMNPRWIAIDEAHCISQWGHDFRPEYRRLAEVRAVIPNASLHACTATATVRVREDILTQLDLRDPLVLVGDIDRPNLTYRVTPRTDARKQVREVVARHRGQAAIVYCATRKQSESTAAALSADGFVAAAYHAGLDRATRTRVQDDFAAEQINVIAATVAFGMGIDRSDVRCIVHASMPDSLERYQQETGRAGRDGLPSECVLLFSGGDAARWRKLHEQGEDPSMLPFRRSMLESMQSFCATAMCRRAMLAKHFGQRRCEERCGSCDVCLGDVQVMTDGTTIARKILSAVARTGQRYGAGYVIDVLRGTGMDKVMQRRHDELSVFKLLANLSKGELTDLVWQLVHLELLVRATGEYPILLLTKQGVEVMRGEGEVALIAPPKRPVRGAAGEEKSWEGVNRDLFDRLRLLRRELARTRGVPAYVVFGDASLREMARMQPSTPEQMLEVKGVGDRKLAEYGEAFLEAIGGWKAENG
ncbi:MAG: DNA helicase RecQ [Phycisphaerales bacterium]|nr:DNA helicase RecQ [Phycisphaerales bacterium]MDP7188403.1 DNA helicase RecQ [Phycisphaerales bacterium]